MGNSQGKRSSPNEAAKQVAQQIAGSPSSPGSPLTYIPQTPMEPIGRPPTGGSSYALSGRQGQEYHPLAGWPLQPKLVPTVIIWTGGGDHVQVEGSFDEWQSRQPMAKSGKNFTIVKLLAPGVYQYKFIVDGEWKYDPSQPAMFDDHRNVNNVLEVQEYAPENLESLSGFDPPPSPPSSYNRPDLANDDYSKDPPLMPPHLQLTLLNVPPALDATASLPRPQHVILNHIYSQRTHQGVNATVVGTTHRYKSKYITSVLYKPTLNREDGR